MKHKYMPISVSINKKSCLVVGGGQVALRKVETLMDYDTSVTVIAPEVEKKIEYHAEQGRIKLKKREYQPPEAAGFGLVISASDDKELNKQIYDDAHEAGALVNVVDDPPLCDFVFPAVLRRDCLTAAISTDGKAPFMSGHLRIVLENIFPTHWNRLMQLASEFRNRVREKWAGQPDKKNLCYAEFLEADWKTLLKEKDEGQIEEELNRMLEKPA